MGVSGVSGPRRDGRQDSSAGTIAMAHLTPPNTPRSTARHHLRRRTGSGRRAVGTRLLSLGVQSIGVCTKLRSPVTGVSLLASRSDGSSTNLRDTQVPRCVHSHWKRALFKQMRAVVLHVSLRSAVSGGRRGFRDAPTRVSYTTIGPCPRCQQGPQAEPKRQTVR